MIQKTIIQKNIVVPAHKLHIYNEYINKIINTLKNKNYSKEIGYIKNILEIIKIENFSIVNSDFSGSVVFKVTFLVENCNPKIGDIIDCKIIQKTNIILASNEPLKIIIIADKNSDCLNKNDNVKIELLCTEINYNLSYIKAVGKYIK